MRHDKAARARPVTSTVEDYLQLIYKMIQEQRPVLASRLAERLNVSLPTVLATIQRMTRDGLAVSDERRQIGLTPRGMALAEAMVRRQRLAERLLVDVLGLEWAEAHTEAHMLEHAISPKVEARINALLHAPTTCPHGNPIPGNGAHPARDAVPIATGRPGDTFVVERLTEEAEGDPTLLAYLQRHRVMPGLRLTVTEVEPAAGMIAFEGEAGTVTLGLAVAEKVYGRRVKKGAESKAGSARADGAAGARRARAQG
ncbi:MAG TPA: metal-dependent transcriptional regulator [Thermodesulfobacteriota bacterium]|nr:metal-dependent transcriptional regulator [Thermodesulfobacteriota bacterium]